MAMGVAVVVEPEELTPETASAAVMTVPGDAFYHRRAGSVRVEIAALPGAEHAMSLELQPCYAAECDGSRSLMNASICVMKLLRNLTG